MPPRKLSLILKNLGSAQRKPDEALRLEHGRNWSFFVLEVLGASLSCCHWRMRMFPSRPSLHSFRLTVAFLLVGTLALPGLPKTTGDSNSIVFLHVTIVDMNGGPPKRDYALVIRGERIDDIRPAAQFQAPEGAQVVDARGKFVIPGLWDMHVHIGSNTSLLPFYVANGVTGVRSMADSVATVRQIRRQIETGELTGPRILATAGTIVDGPNPVWPGSISAASEAEGVEAVDKVIADGSDFVKVYDMLPRAAYFGIAREARAKEIPFVGHLPMAISASEASEAGQKSIEHLIGIPLACSLRETYLRQEVADTAKKATSVWPAVRAYRHADIIGFESYSAERAAALFSTFVKNGTWVVPTLTNTRASIYSDDRQFRHDPRLTYMPQNLINFGRHNDSSHLLSNEERRSKGKAFLAYLQIVQTMHGKGVEILAGTDTPNPYSFPGFGLHDELKLLVDAGFTPLQALQAATRDAARFMGQLDSNGTVEKSKMADLVLLDANPLNDIRNIDSIRAVVIRGKLFDKNSLRNLVEPNSAP